jgi:very-short-patch-repair endonuclease
VTVGQLVADDRQRDAELRADGFTIPRFTADQVEDNPRAVLARVTEAMEPSSSPAAVRQTRG